MSTKYAVKDMLDFLGISKQVIIGGRSISTEKMSRWWNLFNLFVSSINLDTDIDA